MQSRHRPDPNLEPRHEEPQVCLRICGGRYRGRPVMEGTAARALIEATAPMSDTRGDVGGAPTRDFCPALRNIRLRLRRRLAAVDQEVAAFPESAALRDALMTGLAREREQIVAAFAHVNAASEEGLAPQERIALLETLLAHLPGCVTQRARARVGFLIEGLEARLAERTSPQE
jgi:hypothetical protein